MKMLPDVVGPFALNQVASAIITPLGKGFEARKSLTCMLLMSRSGE
jgi:hypothetical protein